MRASVSSSTSPSMAMTPRSGFVSPAIMLTSEVFPAPEAPNRPVTRPSLAKATSTRKFTELFCDVNAQHGQFPCRRLCGAPREPFGGDQGCQRDQDRDHHQPQCRGVAIRRLDQRIDRRGNGLGFAGDVGHEGNGGAELADRLGKAEHHAGQHARQRQRQRDRQEHPPGCRAQRARRLLQPAVDRLDRQPDRPHQQRKRHDRRRPAPPRSSETRTRCRDDPRASRRSGRGARTSAAADSR